jgi:hypothetical protein
MEIVIIDQSIWLMTIHLITCQMGHIVKSNKNDIFGQNGQWVFSQIKHFVKLNKKNNSTYLLTYLPTHPT